MLYFKFIQFHESIRQSGDAKDIVSRWKTFKGDYILEQLFEIYKPIRTTHLEELRAKQQEKQEAQINQLILRAHTLTAEYASSAKKKYDEQGKLFGNMVSVVMDLSTGDFAKGRAAHGKNQTTLHHRIVAILPTESANAFVAQTYGNCSEVDALDKLLKKCPSTKLENLYFSSAKPDNQKLIPPCANCQRWIKKVGAKAWEGVAL